MLPTQVAHVTGESRAPVVGLVLLIVTSDRLFSCSFVLLLLLTHTLPPLWTPPPPPPRSPATVRAHQGHLAQSMLRMIRLDARHVQQGITSRPMVHGKRVNAAIARPEHGRTSVD